MKRGAPLGLCGAPLFMGSMSKGRSRGTAPTQSCEHLTGMPHPAMRVILLGCSRPLLSDAVTASTKQGVLWKLVHVQLVQIMIKVHIAEGHGSSTIPTATTPHRVYTPPDV